MKYFFLSLLVFLSSCDDLSSKIINPNDLKFKLGQSVKLKSGFYSNCIGTIVDYKSIVYYDKPEKAMPYYVVNLDCGSFILDKEFIESDLINNEE